MRIYLLFVLLLGFWAHALPTSPVDTVEIGYPTSSLVGWQACAAVLASASSSFRVSELTARCAGPHLMIACVQSGIPNTLTLAAGSNTSVVLSNSTVNDIAWFSDSGNGRFGFANATAAPANCLVASGNTICRNVANGVFAPGMYCPNIGGYTISQNVMMVIYSDPCGGSAIAGDACTNSFGLCQQNNTCQANATCSGGADIPQPASDPCVSQFTCNPAYGNFSATYRADGETCTSPNLCSVAAQCDALHQCVVTQNLTCPSIDPCKLDGLCNSTSGTCYFPNNAPDNITGCTDGNACTQPDYCFSGICVGTPLVAPNITCQNATTCNTLTGAWSYTNLTAGAPCLPNSACVDAETLGANFQCNGFGSCAATVTTNCSALPIPKCRLSAICNATNANCSYPLAGTGKTCDDENPCTQGTFCGLDGNCGNGGPSVSCPSDPSTPCFLYVPSVFNASTCVCMPMNATDNTTCSIGGAPCLVNTRCLSGVCVGDTRTCPGDDCNAPTTCSNTTECVNPTNFGGACNRTCYAGSTCSTVGTCIGGSRTPEVVGCAIGDAMQLLDRWIFGSWSGNVWA